MMHEDGVSDSRVVWTTKADFDYLGAATVDVLGIPGLLIIMLAIIHSLYYVCTAKPALLGTSVKVVLSAELTANILFLVVCIGFMTQNNNFLSSDPSFNERNCSLVVYLVFPCLIVGKVFVYFMYSYRLYIAFEGSVYAVSKTICVLILSSYAFIVVSFCIALIVTVFFDRGHDDTPDEGTGQHFLRVYHTDYIMCYSSRNSDRDHTEFDLVVILGALYTVMDVIACVYVLWLFISRLRRLQSGRSTSTSRIRSGSRSRTTTTPASATTKALQIQRIPSAAVDQHEPAEQTQQQTQQENTRTGADNNDGNNYRNKNIDRSNPSALEIQDTLESQLLFRSVIQKQGSLGIIGILSTFIVQFLALAIGGAAVNFMVIDRVINVVCVHLAHRMSERIWNRVRCLCLCTK